VDQALKSALQISDVEDNNATFSEEGSSERQSKTPSSLSGSTDSQEKKAPL